MISWLKRFFLSERYYKYQNLAARYKLWNGAPYKSILFDGDKVRMNEGDSILDEMDGLWNNMSWLEKRSAEHWVKAHAILPK
jgi:hypothetical protein